MAVKKTRLGAEPADGAFAVTPSDVTVLVGARALYVGGAGNLTVEMLNPESAAATVTFSGVPAGTLLPISVERVLSTGTTATLIVALR